VGAGDRQDTGFLRRIAGLYTKSLIIIVCLVIAVAVAGTVGFSVLEHRGLFDSFYLTIITLATVGYGDLVPQTLAGRAFAVVLIVTGLGVLAYGAGTATAFIVEGHLISVLRRRKMNRQIAKLTDHIVVCGAGNTGRHIIEELAKTKRDFVVVERERAKIDRILEQSGGRGELLYVVGDATEDYCLREAGIEKAHGLIASLGSDKDNLFVVVAARSLNPSLRIVSRVVDTGATNKIFRAGADAVVSPDAIGGLRMASEMIRPTVVSFLDTMLRSGKGDLRIEEAAVSKDSELVGKRLEEARLPEKTGTIVVAIRTAAGGRFIYNPPKHRKIDPGDILIAMGEAEQMRKLRAITGGPHRPGDFRSDLGN